MQLPRSKESETRSQEALPEDSGTAESEGNERLQITAEGLIGRQKARIDAQEAEIRELRASKERYVRKYEAAKERIAGLEDEGRKASRVHQENLGERDQRIRATEDELARTEELLSARTKELSGAQSFLSTTDRLSEAEVLGIVRDLNENVFQTAANLTEEWERLGSTLSTRVAVPSGTLGELSGFYGRTLIHRAFNLDSAAVTYLVQSCLCCIAAELASSWRHSGGEFGILASVYKHLSTSEAQAISAKWRSLTHNHLSKPSSPHDPTSIAKYVANALYVTGLFRSVQDSLDFVKAKAFTRIETIYKIASRLESAFMVDVTSTDMYLYSEAPRTAFDNTRMAKDFASDDPPPQERGEVAGTTEVGVARRVWRRRGEDMHVEVLLKATVVLEGDFTDSGRLTKLKV